MESLLDFMQDSAPVSAPTAKPEQEQEKEFTVSEISAEIKRFVETPLSPPLYGKALPFISHSNRKTELKSSPPEKSPPLQASHRTS